MTSAVRLSVLIFALDACAGAQTYTYQIKLQANNKTGKPMSGLTIVGAKGYGSSQVAGPELYQAQPSTGVHATTGCCGSTAPLAADSSRNLYGEDARNSNQSPRGRIFAVKPGFKWIERDLYDFTGGNDGWVLSNSPTGAPITQSPIVFDSFGNIFGMTYAGGEFPCVVTGDQVGCGVVFELTSNSGAWSEQVIHAFSGPPDGAQPEGGLTFDPLSGNYYGTTQFGGDANCNCGTVFELSPNGDGTWSESVVYTFTDHGVPNGGVILDAQGNLYGTNFGAGYAYEISAGQFFVIASLPGEPNGPLVFDSNGNLLGTTYDGGSYGLGTVFELSPTGNGWTETTIHSFAYTGQKPTDGKYPNAGLAMDATGNLWGVTPIGGAGGQGVFFEVTK